MKHTESSGAGVNRRGFFAGLVSGLGVAAVAIGARKSEAAPKAKQQAGPKLYRRTEETERYLKTMV